MTIYFNNSSINDWNFGTSNIKKVYRNGAVVYYKISGSSPTPTGQTPCYAVVDDITQYASRDFIDVYDKTASKWYKLNNLNQYEEYGIIETGASLSDFTYYNGKLVATGTTEYQYSGNSWVEVGVYISSEVSYPINSENTGDYVGMTLSTSFKIPMEDISDFFDLRIRDTNGGDLSIFIDPNGDYYEYRYWTMDGDEQGTVTNDGTYYIFELPNTTEIVIDSIDYWNENTIHIIVGSKVATVEYTPKTRPLYGEIYETMSAMETSECPFVGKYGTVNNNVYKFSSNYTWDEDETIKLIATYNDTDEANIIDCNSSTELTTGETKPSYLSETAMTSAEIGDCVTSIGFQAFRNCISLSSVTIPDGITTIGESAFYSCTTLTSVVIPNSVTNIGIYAFDLCESISSVTMGNNVTSIGNEGFNGCNELTSITIPSSITSIGERAFYSCTSLTSVTVEAIAPPSLGKNAFKYGFYNYILPNLTAIYVPTESVNAYKSATNWSDYASLIQAIPT